MFFDVTTMVAAVALVAATTAATIAAMTAFFIETPSSPEAGFVCRPSRRR
jgi:hypothetical protein